MAMKTFLAALPQDGNKHARQDSNLQPSVPKTDALSNCATDALQVEHLIETHHPREARVVTLELKSTVFHVQIGQIFPTHGALSRRRIELTSLAKWD